MANRKPKKLSFDDVREVAKTLPGIEEGTCYGTPAFRVRGKFLGRLHDDGESLVLKMDLDSRGFLTRSQPDIYHFTEHYKNHPLVLIRFAAISREALQEHIEDAWRPLASKRLIAEYQNRQGTDRSLTTKTVKAR